MKSHPDEHQLEAARTGEAEVAVVEHVAGCAACRERQALGRALAAELGAPAALVVSAELEREILRGAAAAAARGRRLARWWLPAAAVAAAAAVLFMLWPATPGADVNGDGVVDIVDALALSQMLERGEAAAWDLDGDGVIDARDVDAIAVAAVAINGGGR